MSSRGLLCDGRRNCIRKRSDCHPGNHISFPNTVPMPQPAMVPVLAIEGRGSSQAPRPRVLLLLRRNHLEDRWSRSPRILCPISYSKAHHCDGPSRTARHRTMRLVAGSSSPHRSAPLSPLCPQRCTGPTLGLFRLITNLNPSKSIGLVPGNTLYYVIILNVM